MGFYCALMQIQDLKKTNHEVGIIGLGCSFKGGQLVEGIQIDFKGFKQVV